MEGRVILVHNIKKVQYYS